MSAQTATCKEPAVLVPVVDQRRCEGKEDCVRVCPYGVFALGKLDEAERRALSSLVRVKSFFHGYKTARVVKGDECHACGLCVTACPEKAIKLVAR